MYNLNSPITGLFLFVPLTLAYSYVIILAQTFTGDMMSLLLQIKKDQLQARKNNQTAEATLLTTLIGEASMIGKNDGNRDSTDEEVISVIKKFVKNNNELMNYANKESSAYALAKDENEFLSQYLPSQMTEEEIRTAVQQRIHSLDEISPKLMGKIMGWLKENYGGQYDGALASKVVKELLSGR